MENKKIKNNNNNNFSDVYVYLVVNGIMHIYITIYIFLLTNALCKFVVIIFNVFKYLKSRSDASEDH